MIRILKTVIVLFPAIFFLSGCITTQAKKEAAVAATSSVQRMGEVVKSREQAFLRAYEAAIVRQLETQREIQKQRWLAAKAEQKTKVWVETEKKLNQTLEDAKADLENALTPLLERLDLSLAETRAAGDSPETEASLALQLSATLANAEKEYADIRDAATRQMVRTRSELLQAVEDAFAIPDFLVNSTNDVAAARELLRPLSADGEAFLGSMDAAVTELQNYINRPSDLELFTQGLLGEKLFESIESRLKKTVDELSLKAGTEIDKAVSSASEKIANFLK